MAITFIIEPSLTLDETAGLQNGPDSTSPTSDNDAALAYDNLTNTLTSATLDAEFLTYLQGLFAADAAEDAALGFAAAVEGASSGNSFISVSIDAGETIDNLYFSVTGNGLIATTTALAGEALYFHVDPGNSDFAVLTTSATAGAGRIVAAFYLDEAANHLSAQVQMVTFEPLAHPDDTNHDEAINFSDVLQVSATGSLSFDFDNLASGNFLWVAIGNESAGLLVTGRDLNVNDDSGSNKYGEHIPGGNSDPSDTMNTSQGGAGATIGVNSQHFVAGGQGQNKTDGSTAVFTLVRGFTPLPTAAEATATNQQATGTNIQEIDYGTAGDDYINTVGAGLFVSQLTGTHADMRISLWEAGNGTTAEEGFDYIGNQDTDSALGDDGRITVGSVTVTRGGVDYLFTTSSTNATIGVTVTFGTGLDDNSFTITGLHALDAVNWTSTGGETFNRFQVQALATTDAFDIGRIDILQGVNVSAGLGSHLFVDDDGPSIDRNGAAVPTLTNDDTAIPDTAGPTSFAGLFSGTFGTDGFKDSDNDDLEDADAIRYALGVSAAGVFSGLTDALSGDKIYLYLEAGVVRGRVGLDDDLGANPAGAIAFEVSVNSDNGNVTFVQNRSVVHNDPGDPSETGTSAAGLAAAGLVTLTATIEDGDGDTDTAVADIGDAFKFEDDGPTITRNALERPLLTTDDSEITDTAPAVSFATLFDHEFGKDGFKDSDDDDIEDGDAISFALSLKDGNGTISGLTATVSGDAILLRVNADGDVEGYLASSTATLAFKIDLDPLTGTIALIQYLAVEHDDPLDAVESGASAAKMAADLIVLTATIRDGDGDSDSDPANIGDAFRFEDDGPTITAPGTEPQLTVDESDFGDDDSQSFADVFSRNFGNDGEADSDATSYELGLNAGPTGLIDTESGEAVVLVKDGDDVVGVTELGGLEVFRVSVAANGVVTLDQSRAVVHDDPADDDENTSPAKLDSDHLITLTATITDGDGDQDSATIDIARNLNFEDDGPSVTLDRIPGVFATVDESDLGTDAPVDGASLFDPDIDYGADGEGSAVYSLDVVDAGPTNLETTAGQAISLVQISPTEVQGQYDGGQVAFVVLIDPVDGSILLDQVVALRHANASDPDDSVFLDPGFLDAVLTATDKDGDSASDPADIGPALEFKDDGPTVDAPNVPVIVDDDGGTGGNAGGNDDSDAPRVVTGSVVPIFDFGADGPGDPISYSITLANLVNPPALESQGATVEFTQTGNFLTAYVDTDGSGAYEALNDREVFTFDLDGVTGDFEFTLLDQIDHPTAGTEDDLTINLGVLLQAIDGDGDASNAAEPIQLNIGFDDDSPIITEQISDGIVDGNAVPSSVTNSLNGAVGFDDNDGNDETAAGVKTYTFDSFTTPQNAWPDLFAVLSADKTTISYYESDAPGADLVYSIVLNQDGSGEYTFTVHKQTTSQKLEFDFADLPSGQNLFGVLVDRDDNGVLQVDGKGLLVVGRDAILNGSGGYTNTSDTINTSKGGGGVTIGVDNQMFDPGDGAIFVFLDNPDDKAIGGGGLTQNTADDADTIGFVGTYSTRSAELEVVQKQGSATTGMRITAWDVDVPGPDNTIVSAANPLGAGVVNQEGRDFIVDPLAGGTIVSIDSVKVFDRANPGVLLLDATIDQATGAITFITKAAGYNLVATETALNSDVWTVTVTGFNANDSIVYTTVADHDAVLTEGTSGKWDLGGINLTENIDLPDQVFDFSVAINDYDGDSDGGSAVTFANFSIGVDGTGAADDGVVAGVEPLAAPIAPLAAETIGFEAAMFEAARDTGDFDFAQIFTLGQQYV